MKNHNRKHKSRNFPHRGSFSSQNGHSEHQDQNKFNSYKPQVRQSESVLPNDSICYSTKSKMDSGNPSEENYNTKYSVESFGFPKQSGSSRNVLKPYTNQPNSRQSYQPDSSVERTDNRQTFCTKKVTGINNQSRPYSPQSNFSYGRDGSVDNERKRVVTHNERQGFIVASGKPEVSNPNEGGKNISRPNYPVAASEPIVKRLYNLEIVLSDSRPGDRYLLQSLMQEALLVHNEIVRRINQGVSPGDIEVSSLRHIIYFTENGMIQHIVVHYLTDLQITNLLFEVQQMYYNIVHTHGLPKEKIGLKPLSQIKFLNFRRCGQTHWIDYTNKQIRLLGLRTPLDVKGLEVLEKFPEIKVAGLRLLNKEDGYSVSIQCLIPTNILDEFSRECMISAGSQVNVEEKIKNIEVGNGDIENEENENLDYSLIEALCQKYNRDKDSDKYHNSPRFLKGVAS